jgi:hypothetical protein
VAAAALAQNTVLGALSFAPWQQHCRTAPTTLYHQNFSVYKALSKTRINLYFLWREILPISLKTLKLPQIFISLSP